MPWWSWLWASVLAVMTLYAADEDVRLKEPLWHTVLGILSGACLVYFILAYHSAVLREATGKLFALMLFFCVPWDMYLVVRDYRKPCSDFELSQGSNCAVYWGVFALFALIIVPAWALGALLVWRAWN